MYIHVKRFFDIFFSILLLIILLVIILIVAIAIVLSMGNPIFFKQVRIGKDNMPFLIIKFRTMSKDPNSNTSDGQRLTKLGAVLRKTSIDEIPQLINILKGEMSFIGPRPLLQDYLPFYNTREVLRHNVRPGMSSLASVKGRSYVTWDEQFELDVFYVENLSFCLDLKIFCKTIPKVLGSVDQMVIGRIDQTRFDVHRQKQINEKQIQP